jgi:hypothetical protein
MRVNLPVLASRQFTRKKAFPVTVNGLLVNEPFCVRLIKVPVAAEAGVSTRGGRVAVGGIGLGGTGTGVLVTGAAQAASRKISTNAVFIFIFASMGITSWYFANKITVYRQENEAESWYDAKHAVRPGFALATAAFQDSLATSGTDNDGNVERNVARYQS